MALRDRASSPGTPSLTTIADYSEFVTLFAAALLVLTVAAFGVAGAVVGFSVALAIAFGEFALGLVLVGASFFGLSLLIGLIEDTYFIEEERETLPEQAAEAQESEEETETEYEQIGEPRAPEEHRVK